MPVPLLQRNTHPHEQRVVHLPLRTCASTPSNSYRKLTVIMRRAAPSWGQPASLSPPPPPRAMSAQGIAASYMGRSSSPAPSVQSSLSQDSSVYGRPAFSAQSFGQASSQPANQYQSSTYQQPYQQPAYQQSAYQQQQPPYQQAAYQQSSYPSGSYQQSSYQASSYAPSTYQETSYQSTGYQPNTYGRRW